MSTSLATASRKKIPSACRALVVDSSVEMGRLLEMVLEECGYDTRVVADREAFLDVLHAFSPDIVLLDLLMPGIGGSEAFEALHAQHADARVIATAGSEICECPVALQTALQLGAMVVLLKPFECVHLEAALRAAAAHAGHSTRSDRLLD